jgi:pilus assembly protein Flp/PilA
MGESNMKLFARFATDESGATAIEYALIAAGMGVGLVAAMSALSGSFSGLMSAIAAYLHL